jgi:hypothetical protein
VGMFATSRMNFEQKSFQSTPSKTAGWEPFLSSLLKVIEMMDSNAPELCIFRMANLLWGFLHPPE